VLALSLGLTSLAVTAMLSARGARAQTVYALYGALGVAIGYWAVFATVAAEQFGTNLRATVATAVPNLVRGAVVPLTLSFKALKADGGPAHAARVVGAVALALAFLALWRLRESYGKELDYNEE
jgi:hypothetical protein